jgi:type IV fimbrial biogenesis protein FimT
MSNDLHRRFAEVALPAAGAGGRQRGVTMVELMTTIAIAAVLLGSAAPSFVDSIRANRAVSAAQQMTGLLREARSEAMSRNVPVIVCPSADGVACVAPVRTSSWAGRTIVCRDGDGDGACDASTSEAPNPVRVRAAVDASVTLSGPASVVRFNGVGATSHVVTFSISAGTGQAQSSAITVATTGAVRVD